MDIQRRDESDPKGWRRRLPMAGSSPRRQVRREFAMEGLEDRRLLSSAGSLDTTFHGSGSNLFPLPGLANAVVYGQAMALQDVDNQEKIVLVGSENPSGGSSQSDFVVIRFNSDGSLDTSFAGGSGFLTIPFDDSDGNSYDDRADAVAIDPNTDDIIVAGSATTASGSTEFAVARLTPDGALDPTFGGTTGELGTTFLPVGNTIDGAYDATANAVGVDQYGNIVLGGSAYRDADGDFGVAVAELNAYGELNTGFDGGGTQVYYINGDTDDNAYAMSLTDGQILLAGSSQPDTGTETNMVVFDITSSGSFNTNFGDAKNGIETITDPLDTSNNATAYAIAVQSDGKIILAGEDDLPGNSGDTTFSVVRLDANGSVDGSFADTTPNPGNQNGFDFQPPDYDDATAVAVQTDGQIVVAGQYYTGKEWAFAVSRLNSDGSFDKSFGSGGISILNTMDSSDDDFAQAVLIQPDGNIVVGGDNDSTPDDFIVARVLGSSTTSPTPTSPTPTPTSPTPTPTSPTPTPTSPTPTPTSPTPTPAPTPTPVVIGDQPVFSGKGKKRKIASAQLFFSGALDFGTAQNTGNYRITQRVKKKTLVVPVLAATYNPGNNSVTLLLGGSKKGIAMQLTIGGLRSSGEAPLSESVIEL